MIQKPELEDVPNYYRYYLDLIEQNDLMEALSVSKTELIIFIEKLPLEKLNFAYEAKKWTVCEVLRHIIDTERILQYRVFRFSRFDATELAGFDEDFYIEKNRDLIYSYAELIEEFTTVRNASISLFKKMTNEMLDFKGTANTTTVNARGIGFMIVGHQLHHVRVLNERYLN